MSPQKSKGGAKMRITETSSFIKKFKMLEFGIDHLQYIPKRKVWRNKLELSNSEQVAQKVIIDIFRPYLIINAIGKACLCQEMVNLR